MEAYDASEWRKCMKTIREIVETCNFEIVNGDGDMDREIKGIFCCDLLSIAMSKAQADYAWVTVMANINTLAVATLTDVACVVLAHDMNLDVASLNRARMENIIVLRTPEPIFEAANAIAGIPKAGEGCEAR